MEYNDQKPSGFPENSGLIRSNVGSVTEVGKCHDIIYDYTINIVQKK